MKTKFLKTTCITYLLALSILALHLGSCEVRENESPTVTEEVLGAQTTSEKIPGKYIVVLREDGNNSRKLNSYQESQEFMRVYSQNFAARFKLEPFRIERVYSDLLKGFSAELNPQQAASLRSDPKVLFVEQDQRVYATQTTQTNATWGIDRIDQLSLPLSTSYIYSSDGSGVTVYILDTGIRFSHTDFEGRAFQGFDAFGGNSGDVHGHGTHVAGTVGSKTYGVAKKVKLVSIKVLDDTGSGSWSGILAGLDWVSQNKTGPSSVNMSLGGSGSSSTINTAIEKLYNLGVPVIVAAGNDNVDASGFTPANAPRAFAVGASTSTDARSTFSNYGATVKVFAPGSGILSTSVSTNTSTATYSGTSMASPHVAGVSALLLQRKPTATAQEIYDYTVLNSTKNIILNPGAGTVNNHLANSNSSSAVDPDPIPNPVINLTATWVKSKGQLTVNLSYSGISLTSNVDIYRNGTLLKGAVNNTQSYQDRTSFKGSGTLTYRVCAAGTSTCSPTITVNYN